MTTFDETAFLNSTVDASFDTRRAPIPVGRYVGVIKDIKARANVQGRKDPTKSYNFLDYVITINLTDEARSEMGTEAATLDRDYSLILDLTPAGTLDMSKGKNIGLGILREAVGQNVAGKSWNVRDPVGQMINVDISHRMTPDGDPVDFIKSVSAA